MKLKNQRSLPLTRDPFGSLFSQLFHDFNSIRDDEIQDRHTAPRTNIAETDKSYELAFELPGVSEDDINVQLKDKTLTVTAERKDVRDDSDSTRWHRLEHRYGHYSRAISLPADAADADIEAVYETGVLTVTVPKREEAKPAKITVRKA